MEDRIYFHGNPWPEGHKIEAFSWSGRLEPNSGLWFDLHLETEDYYANDDPEEEEELEDISDWQAKIVWCNYHSCTLSSIYWGHSGFLVGTEQQKFNFQLLAGTTYSVDPLSTYDFDDPAFHTYLLGHDSAADHRIHFLNRNSHDEFTIKWDGKLALSYAGDDEFKYTFETTEIKVPFEGIHVPERLTDAEAHSLLAEYVENPEIFTILETKDRDKVFVLK